MGSNSSSGSTMPFMKDGIPDINGIMRLLMGGMRGRMGGPMNMGQIAPPTLPPAASPPTAPPPTPPTGGGFTSGQSPISSPMGVPNTNTPTDNDGGSQIFNTANTNNSGWLSKVMPKGGGIGAPQSRPPLMAGQIIR
jgi:hypothetical protein